MSTGVSKGSIISRKVGQNIVYYLIFQPQKFGQINFKYLFIILQIKFNQKHFTMSSYGETDPESQNLVTGENTGQEAPKTTSQLVMAACCNALVSCAIGGYALYVGAKYKTNTTPQCVTDVNWLNIWGYLSIVLTIIPILLIPCASQMENSVLGGIAKGVTGLLGCASLFLLGKF